MRRYILLLVGILFSFALSAQNVTNADFYQEGENIIITYDLDKIADVIVQISTDGGKTFSAPLKRVSGDVGKNVLPGTNRIIWDVLAEYGELVGDIIFEIRAGHLTKKGRLISINIRPKTYLYLGADYTNQSAGYSFDWQMGMRLNQRVFLGTELGWHQLINAIPYTYEPRNFSTHYWYIPMGVNMKVYFPIKKDFTNSWHLSLSGGGYMGYGYYDCGDVLSLNSHQNEITNLELQELWKRYSIGGYASAGLGMDFRAFTFGAGYTALIGNVVGHIGYIKLGVTLGKTNK